MMRFINNDGRFVVGFADGCDRPNKSDHLSPAERKLLEQIADRLLEEHSDTLKKLGDE